MFACFTFLPQQPCSHTSMARALKLDGFFSDYFSTWMAEGRGEGNNHSVSLAVYALPSHFTNLTILPKRNEFSLHGIRLACVHGYVTRHLSVSKTVQVGKGLQLECQESW